MAGRALWWERTRTLFAADLHLGKAATFRSAGIPVPEQTTSETLARLGAAIRETRPERLVILGDLIHAVAGRAQDTMAAFAAWRRDRDDLKVQLIRGNHDRRAGDPPSEWDIQCLDAPVSDGPFQLCHDPSESGAPVAIAGHLHPMTSLGDGRGMGVRTPCFWLTSRFIVLPAFGAFTGGRVVRPGRGDRIIAVGPEAVAEMPVCR
jgi:DNA ligase-associated metallophosphoesterase